MILTVVGIVFIVTIFITYLIGYTEGRNKGYDGEQEAYNAGRRDALNGVPPLNSYKAKRR